MNKFSRKCSQTYGISIKNGAMNFVVPIVLAIASGTLLGEAVFLRGMRMLDKWRRRNPDMPLAESIEKIPFSETRN